MSTAPTEDNSLVSQIPQTVYLIMQEGIEPGFSPSIPIRQWLLTRATSSDKFIISFKEKPHGKAYVEDKVMRTLHLAEHASAMLRLLELLADIPTQYPGAPDMYGRNMSIVHVTQYEKQQDLYKSGNAAAEGIPLPTEEQRVKFEEAVAIVSKWSS